MGLQEDLDALLRQAQRTVTETSRNIPNILFPIMGTAIIGIRGLHNRYFFHESAVVRQIADELGELDNEIQSKINEASPRLFAAFEAIDTSVSNITGILIDRVKREIEEIQRLSQEFLDRILTAALSKLVSMFGDLRSFVGHSLTTAFAKAEEVGTLIIQTISNRIAELEALLAPLLQALEDRLLAAIQSIPDAFISKISETFLEEIPAAEG